MIIYTKGDGFYYKHERSGKTYGLHEAHCLGGKATTDRIIIWDDENDRYANHVMGGGILSENLAELDEDVSYYVEQYEARCRSEAQKPIAIRYEFNEPGVENFKQDVVDDILDRDIFGDFKLSHGNREISIPDLADIYEAMCIFLDDAREAWEE